MERRRSFYCKPTIRSTYFSPASYYRESRTLCPAQTPLSASSAGTVRSLEYQGFFRHF